MGLCKAPGLCRWCTKGDGGIAPHILNLAVDGGKLLDLRVGSCPIQPVSQSPYLTLNYPCRTRTVPTHVVKIRPQTRSRIIQMFLRLSLIVLSAPAYFSVY